MNNHTQSKCLACDKHLVGRIDKKFCNDFCRNNYNNQKRADTTNYARNIINALRRNKNILQNCLQDQEKVKVSREKLLNLGFQFKYHTHHYETQKGNDYIFCFEYGYLLLEGDWILLVKRDES